jgi:hypothetical protein
MSTVTAVYNKSHAQNYLTLKEPDTFNHFTNYMQQELGIWLTKEKVGK